MKKHWSKPISLLLCVCMIIQLLPVTALAAQRETDLASHSFQDVAAGSWYEEAVQYVYENGIFSGTGETTFGPEGTMTRGMFVTVLGRMAGADAAAYAGQSVFSDVAADAWYAPYVAWAARHGITSGTGDGRFSPDATITRQEMATLFVNYFTIFGVSYDTGNTISTVPADLDLVADWAKDAVLALWSRGLLNGDGANFMPHNKASRAEGATLCMRFHQTVETWYQEPGVPAEEGNKLPEIPGLPSGGGGSATQYYLVQFAMGDGLSDTGVTLPEQKLYPSYTQIQDLPTPYANGQVFLGWYYDSALTRRAATADTVSRNMTLYAQMAAVDRTPVLDTPTYCSKTDVDTGFSFQVRGESAEAVREALTILQISANNTAVDYSLSGTDNLYTVTAAYQQGHTYRAQLDEYSDAVFVVDGVDQPDSTDSLNFTTYKGEVLNLGLDEDMVFLPTSAITYMSGSLSGLFTVTMSSGAAGGVETVEDTGSFTYTGTEVITVGDTVAIYEGQNPLQRSLETDNDGTVVYVTITAIDDSTYSYQTAEAEQVLFTPDVLPIPAGADQDQSEKQITVDPAVLDFSGDQYAQMGLSAQTTVDVGDFIGFYQGDFGAESTRSTPDYARITGIRESDGQVILTYEPVTLAEIQSSMDIYQTRTEAISLSDSEVAAMEADIARQAWESGFVDEAVVYLSNMALETDGFQDLPDDTELTSVMVRSSGPISLAAARKSSVEITEKKVDAKIKVGPNALEHFKDGAGGLRAELTLTFEMEIKADKDSDNKLVISMEAVFEQEVLVGVNVSGGAIWKWAWIFPYIYDYQLNANFDIGTYTGIAITATMATASGDEDDEDEDDGDKGGIFDFSWDKVIGDKDDEDDEDEEEEDDPFVSIGKQIEELMDQSESFFGEDTDGEDEESEEDEPIHMSLLEQYGEMMEEANDSWIELVRKEIFSLEGSVDPFHILVYGISADFVVSANVYITLGMTFEYGNAKRYNYSLMLFHGQCTNETIDLETAHYEFVFYVMGTLGVRAGVEFEIAIGLISLKLASIGITAEAGAYAQLWGYFYYKLTWEEGRDKEEFMAGALHFEVGIYLVIKFKAQLFSSDKLTYNPTLYENQWPLYTVGDRVNVYDFNYAADNPALTEYSFQTVRTLALPTDLFAMAYMDMQTGELYGMDADNESENPAFNYDDDVESCFEILFTNPAFSYEPRGNVVTVTPEEGSISETTEMTILWTGGTLAFTSIPIRRTITITWSDPQNTRYIAFNSQGGSMVPMLSAGPGTPISQPAAPTKQGYTFGGWYEDPDCTSPFDIPDTMPDYADPDRGVTVYAKWVPAPNTYKVEYYEQELNGQYTLAGSGTKEGYTESAVQQSYDVPTGFRLNEKRSTLDQTVAANGSTVVKVYFDRQKYTLTFSYGQGFTGDDNPDVVYADTKFGAAITPPVLHLGGYAFGGWDTAVAATMPAQDVTYTAQWTPATDIPFRVEYYVQDARNPDIYYYQQARTGTGQTGGTVALDSYKTFGEEGQFAFSRATVGGQEVTSATILGDGSLVIKLYFNRSTYTASWDVDGTVTPVTYRYGQTITPPETPQKTGYTFDGWEGYTGGMTMPAQNVTFTARWTANGDTAYTVEHYWQDVTGDDDTLRESETLYGTTGGQTAAAAKDYPGFAVQTFEQTAIAPDGSTVVKIYYDRNVYTLTWDFAGGTASGDYTQGEVRYGTPIVTPTVIREGYGLSWDVTPAATMPAQDTTYTAIWTAGQYTISFQSNGGSTVDSITAAYGTAVSAPADPVRIGYTFAGWYRNSDLTGAPYQFTTMPVNGLTLYAKWNIVPYEISYDLDGGSAENPVRYTVEETVALAAPTKTGHTFRGWTGSNGTTPQTAVTIPVGTTGDLSYTANWQVNRYTIHFENGGELADITADYGASITWPAEPVRNGYTFAGWYVGDEPYYGSTAVMPELGADGAEVTLTARWTPVEYTITYEGADGDDGWRTSYTVETETFQLPIPAKVGYTFRNWTEDGAAVTEVTAGSTGNRTFTANWTPNTYQVVFDGNGAGVTGSMAAMSFTYDVSQNLTAGSFARDGWTFAGWNTKQDGTGQSYADGASVKNLATSGAVTLYAQWTQTMVTVTFKDHDGTVLKTESVAQYTGTATPPANPTRTGYTFAGWDRDSVENFTQDTTITAQYTANQYGYSIGCDYDWRVGEEAFGTASVAGNPDQLTYDQVYTISVSPASGYRYAGFTLNGTRCSGTTFTAGLENDIVVHFVRENAFAADTSWYQVTASSKVGSNRSDRITVDISWSDGQGSSFTLPIYAEERSGSSAKSGVYPTHVHYYKGGDMSKNLSYTCTVSDLSNERKTVASGSQYWINGMSYNWNVTGITQKVNTSIPTVYVSPTGTAQIDLTMYGINGVLSGITYTTDCGAVSVAGSVLSIDGSKLSGPTTVHVTATGSGGSAEVTSFTVALPA